MARQGLYPEPLRKMVKDESCILFYCTWVHFSLDAIDRKYLTVMNQNAVCLTAIVTGLLEELGKTWIQLLLSKK